MPTPTDAKQSGESITCDLLVVGGGAGGFSTAITARKHGLDVIVVEKEDVFAGATAFSGGVLWVPGNPVSRRGSIEDSRDAARTFIQHEAGEFFDPEATEVFLGEGPRMVEFFERGKQPVREIAAELSRMVVGGLRA